MDILQQFGTFFSIIISLLSSPLNWVLLFGSTMLGIVFGALPGLTATLGVALLTTLTYGLKLEAALISLIGMYVGAIYGGSYGSILVNIPGTPASAATALEGYPMSLRGEGGRAIGLTTTSSFIGTVIGALFLIAASPLVLQLALGFQSFEFFALALFGVMICATLSSTDLPYKGWIAGFIGLALAMVGQDRLQSYPRFTFGLSAFEGGLDVVPVLIGAFAIPQIIKVLQERAILAKAQEVGRILPEIGTVFKNFGNMVRSALIGVGIGAIPGVGEDVAAWVAYGAARNASKDKDSWGKGNPAGIVASETSNNSCIGGALIPLVTLGIPGSPPAAMLLGAFMLHGVAPGPNIIFERPDFLATLTATVVLASFAMWICGMSMSRVFIKVLQVPATIFLPLIAVLCVIGSYALGLNIWNLYVMVPLGIAAYFLGEMKYPVAPLVIGFILGPMADESLRRALMVSQGDVTPFFTRPISLILIVMTIVLLITSSGWYKRLVENFRNKRSKSAAL
jgi:putative tricarboxylic transport membrane protein